MGFASRLSTRQKISLTILVAALGYFVDLFDMQLFAILRVSSLKSLGLGPDEITVVGAHLLNWQMGGMLLGSIVWGILGDKIGRVYVLFGTILVYSIGNLANAFVDTIPAYAAARFFTGLGLAGELGAGITLLSELLPAKNRSYATSIMVALGCLGPIGAAYAGDAFDWRTMYIVGGILGLILLVLRVSVSESGLFSTMNKSGVSCGNFLQLFSRRERFTRYICCIGIALPIWFLVGSVVIFAPEVGKSLEVAIPLKVSTSAVSYSVGLVLGGFISGLLSQIFKNRKKVMFWFIAGLAVVCYVVLHYQGITAPKFYFLIVLGGFFIGYWSLFMATTAEQFGTNLRATATTTASNFVRASLILNTVAITSWKTQIGFLPSIQLVGLIGFLLAFLALYKLPESFGRDLDFTER